MYIKLLHSVCMCVLSSVLYSSTPGAKLDTRSLAITTLPKISGGSEF